MRTLILLTLLIFLVSCTFDSTTVCETSADCVPKTCCHASEAVNKDNAPVCDSVLCSAECQPGTLDCGQGRVACLAEKCEIILK